MITTPADAIFLSRRRYNRRRLRSLIIFLIVADGRVPPLPLISQYRCRCAALRGENQRDRLAAPLL